MDCDLSESDAIYVKLRLEEDADDAGVDDADDLEMTLIENLQHCSSEVEEVVVLYDVGRLYLATAVGSATHYYRFAS